ncbi:hypothetical protein AMECASPLE_028870 [Ameca splendens]|uniref:Uncharacterized protein n=1 Tax=Ameca splendens TaxID=208324 RepID=A0ABV0ZEE9_9TELE
MLCNHGKVIHNLGQNTELPPSEKDCKECHGNVLWETKSFNPSLSDTFRNSLPSWSSWPCSCPLPFSVGLSSCLQK